MSDVIQTQGTFLDLFSQGRETDLHALDYVEAWHESGEEETRSLAEYLGMTDAEYALWFISPRLLPSIVAARQTGRPVREFVLAFYEQLRDAGDAREAPVLWALEFWLGLRSKA